jgi:hypothetical protein
MTSTTDTATAVAGTQWQKGPRDIVIVSWVIGTFFFSYLFIYYLLTTTTTMTTPTTPTTNNNKNQKHPREVPK